MKTAAAPRGDALPHGFHTQAAPTEALCARVAARFAANPFCTPNFVAARAAGGQTPWIFWVGDAAEMLTGCTAFVDSGRLTRTLEIPSLPEGVDNAFWTGVKTFCSDRRITDLVVNSFASSESVIPCLAHEVARRKRCEFVVHLDDGATAGTLAQGHRRSIKRAQNAGLQMRVRADPAACSDHAALMNASMHRRRSRGENVSSPVAVPALWPYVDRSAGMLYQAVQNGMVLSSVLVLLARRGAYYHSAGTSVEGMALGASHFLIQRVAESLAAGGREVFNLGGADDAGLIRFKSGFGAVSVDLEAVSFSFGSALKRRIVGTLRDLRSRPTVRLRRLLNR